MLQGSHNRQLPHTPPFLTNGNDTTLDNGNLIKKKFSVPVLNRHYMYSPHTDRNVHYAHPITTPNMPNSDTKSTI